MTAKRETPLRQMPLRLIDAEWVMIDRARGAEPRQQWMRKILLEAAKKETASA